MNVLVIPEDFRKDQYLLKPLFRRLLSESGRPSARVVVCQDPLLGGVAEALKSVRLAEIFDRYDAMIDLFVLCVDRDGDVGRRKRLDQLEREFEKGRMFVAENAWEELETWTLAGIDLPPEWSWSDVRAEVDVKERYFDVLADQRGLSDAPGRGRKPLGEEASRRLSAIRLKCPDFDELARRVEGAVAGVGADRR